MNISEEIVFKTTRSGGKGGQNVNKVETAVIAMFAIETSLILTDMQKNMVLQKLASRINADGILQVRSQTYRTQAENKHNAIIKINALINQSLIPKKLRIATKATKASKEKRLDSKKIKSKIKEGRRKFDSNE